MLPKPTAASGMVALLVCAALAAKAPPGDPPAPADGDAIVRYDRDVRPLLADRCFKCHGPDEKKRRAKLRLDEPESAFLDRDGARAIAPGDPDASELLDRVASDDSKRRMPPLNSNKKPLTPEEQQLLRRWIEGGARYEPHWSFTPPVRPTPPAVDHESWCRTPIDRFVAAKLESEGIEPGPDADRASLLRRLFLDLTGLPPTPEE